MAAHYNHIWSSGGKSNTWTFVFFKKFQDNSNVHLDFKKWLQVLLLNGSFSDIEYYYFLLINHDQFSSVQSLSRVRLFVTPWIAACTPGLPVHHQLPEFTQTHVHWVGDAIQPSHPLSSPSPPAPNPSQHQSLFQWVNSSHEVAKVLEFQL